jgi:hypothetical protein
MTFPSKNAIFSVGAGGKAPIAPPSAGLMPFKLHEGQAHITLLHVLNRRSVNPTIGAMSMASLSKKSIFLALRGTEIPKFKTNQCSPARQIAGGPIPYTGLGDINSLFH